MTASVLQEASADDAFGSGLTVAKAFTTANLTLGTTLEAWITVSATATAPSTVQDNSATPQVFTLKKSVFSAVQGNQALHLYVLQNNQSTVKPTVTATWLAAQTGKGIWLKEIGGVTATAYDNAQEDIKTAPGTGANAIAGTAISATNAPTLCSSLVMECNLGNGSGLAAGTGYTLGTTGWAFGGGSVLAKSESKRIATVVSTAATMTDATNGGGATIYLIALAMYDEATGNAGSGSPTEGADVVAGSGGLTDAGSGSPTEGHDTVAGVGAAPIAGSGASTEAHDTVAGSGTASSTITGSGAITEPADTVAASGALTDSATGAATEAHDTVAGSGGLTDSGSAASSEGHDTVVGAGLIPANLATWRAVLAAVKAGSRRARLLTIGDSLTAGENSTANKMASNAHSLSYPVQMAPLFLAAPAHQDSWFSNNNAASDFATLDQYDFRIALGAGWAADTSNPTLAGYPIIGPASSTVLAFAPANSIDNFTIWFEKFPGSPQYTVNVDGGSSLGTLGMNAAAGIGSASFSVAAGAHTINIVSNGTAGGKIFGCEAWLSTLPQIQVFTAGGDSWTAGDWTQNNGNAWDPLAMAEFLAPDLTLVCLAKNEQAQGISQATFEANLRTLVLGLLNAGSAVVIFGPPLSLPAALPGTMSEAAQLAYETNMANVAANLGCTFYSLTQSRANWGSFAAANAAGFMYTGDNIHLTPAGYLDVAKALLGVIDSGVANVSEAHDVSAGSGGTSIAGSAAITEAHDATSGAGSVGGAGVGTSVETPDVVASAGATAVPGSGAANETSDQVNASGSTSVSGSGSATEASDIATGVGNVGGGGTGAIIEPSDTVTATGSVTDSGSGAASEGHDTVAAAGAVGTTGAGSAVESHDAASGSGNTSTPGFFIPRITVKIEALRAIEADANRLIKSEANRTIKLS